jgi:hypothetical protein
VQEWKASGEGQRMEHNFLMTQWAKDKEPIWRRVVEKHGGNPDAFGWGTWDFFDWAVGKAWFTIGSVSKARKFGWTRYDDTYETWIETFRSFENAGVLPIAPPPSRVAVPKKLAPHPAEAVAAREAAARKAQEATEEPVSEPVHAVQEKPQSNGVQYVHVDSKRDFEIGHVETVEIVSS